MHHSRVSQQQLWQTSLAEVKQLILKQRIQLPKIFISYAWEGDATSTEWLHTRLTRFRDDLNALGIEVFLDVAGMTGEIEKVMRENLAKSDVVLAICTPRFGERVLQKTNVAFEYNLTLERLANKTIQVYPLWIAGSFTESIPEGLRQLLVRDCRDASEYELFFPPLLSALLGGVLSSQMQALAQNFSSGFQGLSQKLKALCLTVDLESPLLWNAVTDAKQGTTSLPEWLKSLSGSIQQNYHKSKAQHPVTVVLEQQSEYREAYWLSFLSSVWEDLKQQGVLPIYIPLNQVPLHSDDVVSDYLMAQGFEVGEIERIQQHYAVLLILSGFEHRALAKRQNILTDSRWQHWRGHTLILCNESQRQACVFLDVYLQSQSLPATQSFKTKYPETKIKISSQTRDMLSGFQHQSTSVTTGENTVQLTEAQIASEWQQFLENIKPIKPMNKIVFFSEVSEPSLTSRLIILKNTLSTLGFQFSDKIEMAHNVFVICSPNYLAATTKEKQTEYEAIKHVLQNPQKTVTPLWYLGDGFGSSVPPELFKLLVRDCRDAVEDYFQWGSLDNPLGLIPSLLDIRLGTPQGELYQQHWQHFCKTVWGNQGQPSSVLLKLKILSRKMASQETLYQSTKAYYQSPQITLIKEGQPSGNIDAMFNELLDKAQTNPQHTTQLLFAEPGSGKSMSLLKLEEDLWSQFHRYHLIPIRIPLNQIKPEQNDYISLWLKERAHYSSGEIEQLKKRYRFLILLDGYDEFVFEHGEHDVVQLANLNQWQGVSILSCRTQMDGQAGKMHHDNRCYLCPFTTEQIDAYLLAQAKNKPELTLELRQKVHVLPGLIQLIKNPLMLYITSDILPDLVTHDEQTALTRYSLYERFTHKWFQREFVRVIQQGLLATGGLTQQQWEFGLLYFAEQIAVIMFREEKLQIPQTRLDAQAQVLLNQMLVQHSSQLELAALRNACPLKVIGTGFQFIHKSFQEFLVAQALLKALPLVSKDGADYFHAQLHKFESNLWNQLELRKEPAVLDFLSDTKPNYYRLLEVINESKGEAQSVYKRKRLQSMDYQGNTRLAQAAGNAMTVFSYCGYSAIGLNLERIQLQKADMSGSLMMNTNFEGAHFNQVTAVQPQWQRANFQHAKLNVRLGEYAHLQGDSSVECLALHPTNPDLLIAGYRNGEIIVWNHLTQTRVKTFDKQQGHTEKVNCLTMNGETLWSGSGDNMIKQWDVRTGACEKTLSGHTGSVDCLTMSGETLWSGSVDKTIKQWDVKTGACEKTLPGHTGRVNCLTVRGDTLWSGSNDGIKQWDVKRGTCEKTLSGHMGFVTCLTVRGETLWSGGWDDTIKQWDVKTGACEKTLSGHTNFVTCLTVRGDMLWSGGWDNTIKQWDVKTGTCEKTLPGHTDWVNCLTVRGDTLWSGSVDNTIKQWDVGTGTCEKTLPGHTDRVNCLTMRGDTLWSGSVDKTIKQWDVRTGACEKTLEKTLSGHVGIVTCLTVSGDMLWSGSDMIEQWDMSTGVSENMLSHHRGRVTCLTVSGDTLLWSGSGDGTIEQWDMKTGACEKTLKGHMNSLECLTVRGETLWSGGWDKTIKQWDVKTGACEKTLPGHTKNVSCLTVRGETLWSGSKDKTIKQWDVSTGMCQFTFEEHKNSIVHISSHPLNASWVVSMDASGLLLVWEQGTGKVLASEQWQDGISSVAIDLEAGRLMLGLDSGAVIFSEVPAPQYWDKSSPLPLWQIKSITGRRLPLEVRDMQLQGAQISDAPTLALLQQRGTVGEASVQALTPPLPLPALTFSPIATATQEPDISTQNAAVSSESSRLFTLHNDRNFDVSNPFVAIHLYLVQKQQEKPATAGARIVDFTRLLQALQSEAASVTVEHYLANAARFDRRHVSLFCSRGNRYHHLRRALLELDESRLKTSYMSYLDYLQSKVEIQLLGGTLANLLQQTNQLRNQICEVLGFNVYTESNAALLF